MKSFLIYLRFLVFTSTAKNCSLPNRRWCYGLMNSINWQPPVYGFFIAQLGEHCSANAEATGSNPVEAPKIFFSGYFRNCLNCDSLRWSHTNFICIPAVQIISVSVPFLSRVDELNKLAASSVWVFIAQLGEHCSANAEATGSNPVEAPKIFFSGYFRNCLNCDSLRWSHTNFICIPAVQIISVSVPFLSRVDELNKLAASSVWVFIAQLGEHCSANAEATGSNPVEAPKIFFSGYFRNCLNCDSLRWSHTNFICIPAVQIISVSVPFLSRVDELNKLAASSVWVFIAQLGEHCSANAEATGSNPVEAPKIFFSGYFRNCLNCDSLQWSHTNFICIPAVQIISVSVPFLSRVDELNKLAASSVWVFIAQLGEHCSANAEATGSNPVEAPKIFFSGYFRNCLNCDSLRWSHTNFNKNIIST